MVIRCKNCGFETTDLNAMMRHTMTHFPKHISEEKNKCSFCDNYFKNHGNCNGLTCNNFIPFIEEKEDLIVTFRNASKAERRAIAKEHTFSMGKKYREEIFNSAIGSKMYVNPSSIIISKKYDTKIIARNTDTVSAILDEAQYTDNLCALDFASFKFPGGGFMKGSMAQEEALCHESNLYNILLLKQDFYKDNLSYINKSLYSNRMLYFPKVIFERDDMTAMCNIMVASAPNRKAAILNPDVSDSDVYVAMKSRIDTILSGAYLNHNEVIILGAFGCGVFGNCPEDVAYIINDLLNTKYKGCFKKIVIAIPE